MPNIPFLKTFADAWNRHDIDDLMGCMTDDCVFVTSSGTRFEGLAAVREAFEGVFEPFPDACWGNDIHFVSGDRGVSEWVFRGTDAEDQTSVEEQGCDIFRFRGGKILVKDTYLK